MIGQAIGVIVNLFRFHKLKMLAVFVLSLLFFIANFPQEDLSDWVSAKATQATGTYMQFDRMGINLIPSPGITVEDAVIEPMALPAIEAKKLDAAVSVMSALTAKLAVTADLQGIFKGDVNLDFAQAGGNMNNIAIGASGINLEDVSGFIRKGNLMQPALALEGGLNLNTDLKVDHTFEQQPSGTIGADIKAFKIPGQTIMIDFNGVPVPMPLPALDIGAVNLKAKMGDGQMDIEQMKFGGPNSDLKGTIKGTVKMNLVRGPAGAIPVINDYNLNIDITAAKSFLNSDMGKSMTLFLGSKVKKDDANETQYAFALRLDPNSRQPVVQ